MTPKNEAVPSGGRVDRRTDGPVEVIDEGVVLASVEGVGHAIEHMQEAGVERGTALRVLGGPEYHREVKNGTIAKVFHFLASRWRLHRH